MRRETRIIKSFPNETGTLSENNGASVKVYFSLMVTQDFIDGIPGLKSGYGSIRPSGLSGLGGFFMARQYAKLKSDNAEANVLLNTMDSFLTNGPVSYAGAPTD